ncbi:acyltransferase family protein [Bradyrhizobium cenepequi]|uniref:acyltransferase family protein n=1 Tax=Bradyrhizobium cenepequi TaxID=2821403 RepID=UPI001CE3A649|nr:acyltransferase family protein [Bradyrhizobium cenepequi]MCA6107667.1 acyltransferase [Bradyrhizobium cenepequi]
MSLPSQLYRPDIDGLRAIAVLLVLIFHAFPDAAPGGFVGVDVFFVISGFLITGIIARELDDKRFSIAGFYARRIRRIFPALIVVLAVALVVGWLWMLPSAYAQLGSDVFASTAFFANIALLLQSGYFDVESAKKPLLHLWSLGIEEQFYLFWPLLLIVAARLRLKLFWTAAILGVVSFVLNLLMIGANPVATFYLPFTRAFELLAGALLALGWNQTGKASAASDWRAVAGLTLIALAVGMFDSHSAFPGWRAALPVAGSVLLLSAPTARLNRAVLASRPMVWIGLISYPLYLWHWPLLVFFALIKFSPLTLLERGLILLLSVLLAWATYRYIEKPLRFGGYRPRKLIALGASMVLLAALGGAVVWGRGYDFRLPPEIRAMAGVSTQSAQWRFHQCLLDLGRDTSFADDCVDRDRRPLVVVWGDSTAGALLPGLRKAQETRNFGIAQFTSASCVPILNVDVSGTPNCRAMNDKVFSLIRDVRPDIVLMHGTWDRYPDKIAETAAALKRDTGARVVVLGAVPTWRRGLPNEVLRYFLLYHGLIPARWSGGVTSGWFDAVMREQLALAGAEFVSAWDVLCNGDGCLTRIGDSAGDITASDGIHLTEKGSTYLVDVVIDRVLDGPKAGKLR